MSDGAGGGVCVTGEAGVGEIEGAEIEAEVERREMKKIMGEDKCHTYPGRARRKKRRGGGGLTGSRNKKTPFRAAHFKLAAMVMAVLRAAAVLLHNGIARPGVFLFVFASVVIDFFSLRLETGANVQCVELRAPWFQY
jgi:hypothetical protein